LLARQAEYLVLFRIIKTHETDMFIDTWRWLR